MSLYKSVPVSRLIGTNKDLRSSHEIMLYVTILTESCRILLVSPVNLPEKDFELLNHELTGPEDNKIHL